MPVLIHLFGKRRREVIRWGAMEFLLASVTPRRRLMRLKDLLLMLVRAATVLAIVFALASISGIGPGNREVRPPRAASPIIAAEGIARNVHPIQQAIMQVIADGGILY